MGGVSKAAPPRRVPCARGCPSLGWPDTCLSVSGRSDFLLGRVSGPWAVALLLPVSRRCPVHAGGSAAGGRLPRLCPGLGSLFPRDGVGLGVTASCCLWRPWLCVGPRASRPEAGAAPDAPRRRSPPRGAGGSGSPGRPASRRPKPAASRRTEGSRPGRPALRVLRVGIRVPGPPPAGTVPALGGRGRGSREVVCVSRRGRVGTRPRRPGHSAFPCGRSPTSP